MAGMERYCANCGKWRKVYSNLADPRRSLCTMCYANRNVRHAFGDGYMGPGNPPAHRNVEMWFTQPWGQEWMKRGAKAMIAEHKAKSYRELQQKRIEKTRQEYHQARQNRDS